MSEANAFFLVNLLQDVNIIRPIIFMAARDLGLRTKLLVSSKFYERDQQGIWTNELKEISNSLHIPILIFSTPLDAYQLLEGRSGLLIAGSESSVTAHSITHNVFKVAPRSFLKVTLQHGFECLGFLHNRDHDLGFGQNVTFAADVICGWSDESRLTSIVRSQRSKLYVSGAPTVLQMTRPGGESQPPRPTGLVCENLQSIRFTAIQDLRSSFVQVFRQFCTRLENIGLSVTLRPHPSGGQYVTNEKIGIPPNVTLNNNPIYKVNLQQYAYGISAPSSMIIDMILADLPVCVWRDSDQVIDADNFDGLTEVSTADDWFEFSREASLNPYRFIELQRRFLEKQLLEVDPPTVFRRFEALLAAAMTIASVDRDAGPNTQRVLYVANSELPTLNLNFVKPLAPLVRRGEIVTNVLTERQFSKQLGIGVHDRDIACRHLERTLTMFRPTMLVFCRYSGVYTDYMIDWARREGVPTVYHLDDDMLSVPDYIGEDKYKFHNAESRKDAVRYLLDNVDLVYCSTPALGQKIRSYDIVARIEPGAISCSGNILVPAARKVVSKIGYMATSDHVPDLALILPAIIEFLRANTSVNFELFGSIPKPSALDEFGRRVRHIPAVEKYRDYEGFLEEFAKLGWDIGLCPLIKTEFNLLKANPKWVEYTSVGAAVIASRGTVYDDCCADGCGVLVETVDEWVAALERLSRDPAGREELVIRAQRKLDEQYSPERLRSQVLSIFDKAASLSASRTGRPVSARQPG